MPTMTDPTDNTVPGGFRWCRHSTVTDAFDIDGEWWHLIQGRCNRWTCPECGHVKTHKLCRRIAAAKPNRFVTLTCHPKPGDTPRGIWDSTRRQVPELIRRIRKHVGPTEYCRVLEEHQNGFPHFHLLVRSPYIEQETLSRWWCELTDAYIVDVRRVSPDYKVAKYVAKYLSKQVRCEFTDRRVSSSKGFFPPEEPREPSGLNLAQVHREPGTIEDYIRRYYPDAELDWLSACHAVIESRGRMHEAVKIRDPNGLPVEHGEYDHFQDPLDGPF